MQMLLEMCRVRIVFDLQNIVQFLSQNSALVASIKNYIKTMDEQQLITDITNCLVCWSDKCYLYRTIHNSFTCMYGCLFQTNVEAKS